MRITRALVGRLLLGVSCGVALGAAQFDEYGVKSAFVYNFIQFVDWPASRLGPASPLVICVVGESPVAAKLGSVAGQIVKGHSIRLRTGANSRDLSDCHVAYVPDTYGNQLAGVLARHRGSGVLFVTEGAEFASQAVIGLVVTDNRMTFEVNLDLAADQRLTVSSKLLRLARYVHGGAHPGPPEFGADRGGVLRDEGR